MGRQPTSCRPFSRSVRKSRGPRANSPAGTVVSARGGCLVFAIKRRRGRRRLATESRHRGRPHEGGIRHMPPRTPDQIPPILTTKDWSKNKGIIAKLVGETGVGAELKKLQILWSKIQWNVILYDKATATGVKTDGPGLAKLFEAAKKASPAVEAVRK